MTYMMSFTEGERKDAKKSNPDIKLMKVSLNKWKKFWDENHEKESGPAETESLSRKGKSSWK